jgi:hypothetical protein
VSQLNKVEIEKLIAEWKEIARDKNLEEKARREARRQARKLSQVWATL